MYEYVGDPSYRIAHCAEENSRSSTLKNVQDVRDLNNLIVGHIG
jgi:hypothetical protein